MRTEWVLWNTSVGRVREACFVLPVRGEAVAHFARRNTISTETAEVGSSDDGNAHHTGHKLIRNFGVGFLPLLGEPDK